MNYPGSRSRFRIRLLRFLAGGGLATLTHWLIMLALIRNGLDPRLATAAGATAGLLINYLAQYHYAFRSGLSHRITFPRYLAGAVAGWSLNLLIFSVGYGASDSALAAQVIATFISMFANYCLAERFVFHEKAANQPQ
jgi:putative flippase GtrA